MHSPYVVESDILTQIKRVYSKYDVTVVCVDCTSVCKPTHGKAHVYLEIPETLHTELARSCLGTICSKILEKHNIHCHEVVFFAQGTFQEYIEPGSSIHRFYLRDAVLTGTLSANCLNKWLPPPTPNDEDDIAATD